MTEQVDVPAVGRVDKKWVIAGVAVVGAVVGYAWWKRRQGSAGPSSYAVDTTSGSVGSGTGYVNPAPTPGPADSGASKPPATDPEWTQRAIAELGNIGVDAGFASSALGKYLNHTALTADEADIVRRAWALLGRPPQSPLLTYTLTSSASTNGTSSTDLKPPALRITSLDRGGMRVNWEPVSGASGYAIAIRIHHNDSGQDQSTGSEDTLGMTTHFFDFPPLNAKPGDMATVMVDAHGNNGTSHAEISASVP